MSPHLHDAFGRRLSSDDVERRSKPLTVGHYEDEHERLVRAFARWRMRATLTFVCLAIVAAMSIYLSFDTNRSSNAGLKQNAHDAGLANCLGGAELRLAVADGLDSLRRLAISGNDRIPRRVFDRFVSQTQPPIDKLLTQAVGYEYHAPLPPGVVTDDVKALVRNAARVRCERRTEAQFG